MVLVFDLALGVVVGEADVVVRRQQQAGALALAATRVMAAISSGAASCSDEQVVEPEHHQGVGVGQDPFVDRKLVAGLVDALEDGDRVAGGFAGQFLERQRRAVEQLQRAGDALQEVAPRRIPVSRRRATATLRTSVMVEKRLYDLGRIALRLPRDSSRSSRC